MNIGIKKYVMIVAEFVDREAIQEKLLGLHVNFSQGYLFSKPSPTISL